MKTDMELKQDVLDQLRWRASIHVAAIGVEVRHGVVTLTGEVKTQADKVDIWRATRQVSGMKSLVIEVVVKRTDEARWRLDPWVPPEKVAMKIEAGVGRTASTRAPALRARVEGEVLAPSA